jgi:hypothetical protein
MPKYAIIVSTAKNTQVHLVIVVEDGATNNQDEACNGRADVPMVCVCVCVCLFVCVCVCVCVMCPLVSRVTPISEGGDQY